MRTLALRLKNWIENWAGAIVQVWALEVDFGDEEMARRERRGDCVRASDDAGGGRRETGECIDFVKAA